MIKIAGRTNLSAGFETWWQTLRNYNMSSKKNSIGRNSLQASVLQCAPPSDLVCSLFFSLTCSPQNLTLECFHFSPNAESLYDDE